PRAQRSRSQMPSSGQAPQPVGNRAGITFSELCTFGRTKNFGATSSIKPHDRLGSFATGSSQPQDRPCPLCRRKRSKFRELAQRPLRVDGTAVDVIQAPKPEPRIMRYELSDYEWTAIKPMLPNKPRGIRRVNDRHVLNGIFWVLRSGAPWRDLPATYGPALPVTIASLGGGGLASGTRSWMRWLPVMTRRCR